MSIGESAKLYGLAAPERQGALGTKLAHAALEYARQNELTVVAICPFVKDSQAPGGVAWFLRMSRMIVVPSTTKVIAEITPSEATQ